MSKPNMKTKLANLALLMVALTAINAVQAQAASPLTAGDSVPVTADNFIRAETAVGRNAIHLILFRKVFSTSNWNASTTIH
jgi:hypothetical protein